MGWVLDPQIFADFDTDYKIVKRALEQHVQTKVSRMSADVNCAVRLYIKSAAKPTGFFELTIVGQIGFGNDTE